MSINAITIDTLSFIHHSVCSWHIFIIFSSSQFCTSPNQAFHDVIKACDKCRFFFPFLFPLYFGMSVECKLCISKVHRNKATPELAIIFLLKSQLFIFNDHSVNLRSSASVCNNDNAYRVLLRWLTS